MGVCVFVHNKVEYWLACVNAAPITDLHTYVTAQSWMNRVYSVSLSSGSDVSTQTQLLTTSLPEDSEMVYSLHSIVCLTQDMLLH